MFATGMAGSTLGLQRVMFDIAIALLGTAGLAETVVEFAYVLTNRESFTRFEEVFFVTSGSFEMLGEVMFLVAGLSTFCRRSDCNGVQALLRDPVHSVAKQEFDFAAGRDNVETNDYSGWSYGAVVVSVLSLTVWATLWPVWGSFFDSDGDDVLRLVLSVFSLALCCLWITAFCVGSGDRAPYVMFVMYATVKAFEEFIVLTDLDRLCPNWGGNLCTLLVAFQLAEILSVAFILTVCVRARGERV